MSTTATEPLGLSRRSNLDDLMSGLHVEIARLKVALDSSRSENIRLSALVDQLKEEAKDWRLLVGELTQVIAGGKTEPCNQSK